MTERDQNAFEEALRSDLAAARQQNMVLTDQLREANTLNEALSYKVDILVKQVADLDASKGQFERVSIRVATLAESVATVAIKQLEEIRDEIRLAAFHKVPGTVSGDPVTAASLVEMAPDDAVQAMDQISQNYGSGGGTNSHLVAIVQGSAGLLPPARFGNGPAP